MTLAFDVIATTKAYQDARERWYPRFCNPKVLDWIRLVARDEAFHFQNLLNVIVSGHFDRLHEAAALLDELIRADLAGIGYRATFVLDHQGQQYSPDFLESCRSIRLRRHKVMADRRSRLPGPQWPSRRPDGERRS